MSTTVFIPLLKTGEVERPPTTKITIDPLTRIEGHLDVEVQAQGGRVVSAKSAGLMFRGFENLLLNKDPRDAVHITQRICGVCPTNHAMASALALEAAAGRQIPDNARIVRNLILGADFLQSHILHFYTLALPSYINGPAMPPWTPTYGNDVRFSAADNQRLVEHYVQALTMRRLAHEMGAILGGRLPHSAAYEFGGVTTVPKAAQLAEFGSYLGQIINFIEGTYLPDVDLLGRTYPEYYTLGRGYGNLLAFGVFDLSADGTSKLLARGRVINGSTSVLIVDSNAILEQTRYSWYDDPSTGLNPSQGITQPNADKADAYSWLKAPRYQGAPYEAGPLARMWVNGDYRAGISVMHRHKARAFETRKIAYAMRDWLAQLNLSAPFYTPMSVPSTGSGIGLTEAPRGALGHWLRIEGGRVASYQILTPTCWNCSPKDNLGVPGPLEKALESTPIADAAQPVEVLRIVHSFDPCLACAVH